jgi:hypothetical protein
VRPPEIIDALLRHERDNAAKALDLAAPPVAITDVERTAGLYSLAVRSVEALEDLGLEDRLDQQALIERVLYVGKAQTSLSSRLADTHFATDKTGWSTVRRTFGALLGFSPTLRPTRLTRPTQRQLMTMSANYGLRPPDERRLTEWMCEQLDVRTFASDWTPLKQLERAVGALLKPPLDQERPPMWHPNPWYEFVAAARERLRHEVRRQIDPATS